MADGVSIKAIRVALAKAMKAELGAKYQVNEYATSDPRPPFAQVKAPSIDPDQAFGDVEAGTYDFGIEVGVAGNLDKAAQEKADAFIEDGMLARALTKDRRLGDLVQGLVITRIEPRQWQQPQSIVGWEFTVRVFL